MIIDCHAHVFDNWHTKCGHESKENHLKSIQKNLTRPAARIFRARDDAPAEAQLLFRKGDNTWNGLRNDILFRVGTYGRLEFTVDGEDYFVQYYPVGMATIQADPELMLAQMSYIGVDHCVLQAGPTYGMVNDLNAYAQNAFPRKFTGLFSVDEAMAYTPKWLQEVERAYHELHLRGLYYQLDPFSRYGFQWYFTDARMDPFWELIASLDGPVFIEINASPTYDEAGYVANIKRLDTLVTRFPNTRWLIVMGPPVSYFGKNGKWEFPDEVDRTYRRDNVQIEIMFPIIWGWQWDYPYPEAQALIRDLRDKYGAEKLLWGSDMPNVERFCTYRQCLDYVRRYCGFFSAKEKDMVLGNNLIDLCKINFSNEIR
jgi:predicted TIM-barrel fold metal-dependent hydrolase